MQNAPYNPRKIDRHARKTLERLLTKKGLLKALVWNEVTSNLVEGHQRLAIMDSLEADDNWTLLVNVVRLEAGAEEVETNIAFNNELAMGYFDEALLLPALKTEGLDLDLTGFDSMDLDGLFPNEGLGTGIFADDERTPKVDAMLRDIDGLKNSAPKNTNGVAHIELSEAEREAQAAQDEAERRKARVKLLKLNQAAANEQCSE